MFVAAKEACQGEADFITSHDYNKELKVIVKERYDEVWNKVSDPIPTTFMSENERLRVFKSALQAQRGFDANFKGNKTEQELLCEHFVSLYESDMGALKNGPEANASWKLAKHYCPLNFNQGLSKDSLTELVKSKIENMRKTLSTADDIDRIMSLIMFLRSFDPADEYTDVFDRDLLVNEFDVNVAMNTCLAKYDLAQVPSVAEIKALDYALDKISPSQPGDFARERYFFDHYSENLKESLLVTHDLDRVKSIFKSMYVSSPNIIEQNGDDSKFADFYIKHAIKNERLNRLTDNSKFLNLLESDKLKVFRFIEARKICIKYIFKNHFSFLNIFFKHMYSENKDPNVQPFMSAYIRYILGLHNYV